MSEELVLIGSLIIAGYLLLLLEAFVTPGVGLAGLGSFLCLGFGCLVAYRSFDALPATGILIVVVGLTTFLLWWIPRTRMGRDVVHKKSLHDAHAADETCRPGQIGIAESDLRPAGIARFGEDRTSVVTDGEYIARGLNVRVTAVHGSRVVVEPAADDAPSPELNT
jgi:membrane-bound serine protease (ClpP class)